MQAMLTSNEQHPTHEKEMEKKKEREKQKPRRDKMERQNGSLTLDLIF